MRALEAEIRKCGDEINALKAFGNSVPQIKDLQQRTKAFQAKYDQIADVTGIDKEPQRLTVQKPIIESGVASSSSKESITLITDTAINSVKKVSISGFTDTQNKYIQEQHKELLKYARDNNGSNEVAFVYRKGLTDRTIFNGSDDVIDFGNGLNGKGDGLVIMHNHPRNSSFSKTDVGEFVRNNDIKTMSIVKNNGNTEILLKTENYSPREAFIIQNRFKTKYAPNGTNAEYDKMVQKYLSYCEKKGLIEWIK